MRTSWRTEIKDEKRMIKLGTISAVLAITIDPNFTLTHAGPTCTEMFLQKRVNTLKEGAE